MKFCGKYLLLVICGLANVADGAQFRCDYKYCTSSRAWYKYHIMPLTWRDARLMCLLEGAVLASPTTPENRVTMIKSTGSIPIFTGLHSTLTKGNYLTAEGIPLEEVQQRWADFQPDNIHSNESCIALDSQGQFFDVSCYEPRPFMCYRNVPVKITECGTHDPAYQLDTRTGHCYKFHTVPRTFERANFACAAEGGHLVIINNEEEANVIREIFRTITPNKIIGTVWKDSALIGFHNWDKDGDWRTIHGTVLMNDEFDEAPSTNDSIYQRIEGRRQTLKEAGYDKWCPGEPNNLTDGEYCGSVLRSGLLNDIPCNNTYLFICEKKPDYPSLCDNNVDHNLNRRNFKQALAIMRSRENRIIG